MIEFIIPLEQESKQFLYEQIYDYIKKEIRDGKLLCGERLPSTRLLASNLQLSRSTVDLAYDQLVSEGYIEAVPYKGYFVSKVEELYHIQKEEKSELPEEQTKEQFLYDFSPNKIEIKEFPLSTWKKISKNVLVDHAEEIFEMGSPKGDFTLRKTICRYLHNSRGVLCEPEQLIIGAGNDYLLMLLQKILGNQLTMAVENPTYKRAYQIFSTAGYQMRQMPVDDSGLQVDALKKSDANIAYVMPTHQFPTGVVMPIGRRLELLNWAATKDENYIIEDDYDSEFRYKGKPIPSLQASDTKEKVIYMGTFSKSIAPAIRISFMVLPKKLLRQYDEKCSFISSTVSRIDQAILNEFIAGGHYERYLNKMRKIYRSKHDFLLEELKPFRKKFVIKGENAGLHLLLESKDAKVQEQDLLTCLSEHKVKVYGMSDYYVDDKRPTHATVIIGYANLSKEQIKQGVALLKKYWL